MLVAHCCNVPLTMILFYYPTIICMITVFPQSDSYFTMASDFGVGSAEEKVKPLLKEKVKPLTRVHHREKQVYVF